VSDVVDRIAEDHCEGKDKLVITRATARALYYALYDTVHAGRVRAHEKDDLERLERLISRVANIGWPHKEDL
jgi:hypothetical protein